MSVRWITQLLGTAPASSSASFGDADVIDVRDLVDKGGNSRELVEQKIFAGVESVMNGRRVIVCCDYGISRSNAIAAGILARIRNVPVDEAAREVIAAAGGAEIKLEVLDVVRAAANATAHNPAKKNLKSSRILVTGASGLLGRAVIERLRNMGAEVSAPPRAELDLLEGSVQLDMLMRSEGIGQVIHLANPRVYTSTLALGSTLVMLRNVLETCALSQVPLIFLSGWEVYSGHHIAPVSADEALPMLPAGVYGETKLLCEALINHYKVTCGLQSTILRLSPVYGPRGDRPKFIYTFIEKAKRGAPIVTHEYINGSPALDLLHIHDAVSAICKATTSKFYGDLNIGTGQLTTTQQVAAWIVQWTGSSSSIGCTAIDRKTARVAMNYDKATKEIGWVPTVLPAHGLRALVEDYLSK